MNAVIGMTSILLDDGDLTAEQKDFVETIRLSGDALLIVINDILDFSKMESNKVALEEQPFDLRGTIEEALELVNIKAAEKGLNLAYTIDASVPETIISDPARLRQILGNLLSNAIKFTDVGEVKLSVSSNQDDVREIHFVIQDTGIGIPNDKLDLLFQSFSQIEPSSFRSESGTGLGLAISKKLVEMMDGRIWVESEPKKGSTFHFTIQAVAVPGEPTAHLKGVQPHLMGKHVLIVDDNKTNRRILGAYAHSWGMVPFVASTSHDALDWIRRGDTFDVAILDMDMSDMDGLTLAEEISKYNKTLPQVMLTSMGKRVPVDHAFHLTKPIKPSQLHKALTEVISRRPAQKSTRYGSIDKRKKAGPLYVLLAEDNVSSQKVILQMLKRLGHRADVVADGIEVCQALERQNYDIVLMDVRMPEMDGLDATRTIRQRWPVNRPKVIAITAHALEGDRDKCLSAGMDDYITKPVKMGELSDVLNRVSSITS
jgi:CheY-like chemotaxis protein